VTLGTKKTLNVCYQRIYPQIHRGNPSLNRDPITQVVESRSAFLGCALIPLIFPVFLFVSLDYIQTPLKIQIMGHS